ncbi:MAG: hypothetical protein FJ213_11820 [Ignavibacteria bacterium]|nr:hypothetical protein [Ignavibacteria bacterium]
MKLTIIIIFSLLVISCGGYNSSILQKSEKSFLKFVGNKELITFSVDEGIRIPNNLEIELYEIKPGKHNIKVYRDNRLIVDRTIFVDNQTIFEVVLP